MESRQPEAEKNRSFCNSNTVPRVMHTMPRHSSPNPAPSGPYGLKALCLCITLLPLTGCLSWRSSKPELPPADANWQGNFSSTGQESLPPAWWESFGDKELSAHINHAWQHHSSISKAWVALSLADSRLQQSRSGQWPSLNLGANGKREWREQTDASDSGSFSALAQYELDLWGKISSESAAAKMDRMASERDLTTAATTLAAQVCQTWWLLLEKQEQVRLLSEQESNTAHTLRMMESRFESGQIPLTDLLRQRQLFESRRSARIQAEAEFALTRNALHALRGESVLGQNDFVLPHTLPDLPSFPHIDDVGTVINRRPDLQAAWFAVRSADHLVAASIANRLPRITLGGSISSAFVDPLRLFDEWVKALTASLNLPIIDGGNRRADTRQRELRLEQALIHYHQIALDAIKEIEDAISQEQHLAKQLQSVDQQIALADQVRTQQLQSYLSGSTNYLEVLSSQDSWLSLQRNRIILRRSLLQQRTTLYRALGGNASFDPESATAATRNQRTPIRNP
jgi:NodT family efflux transporter outer membrane factor (OMF) lipoprotein